MQSYEGLGKEVPKVMIELTEEERAAQVEKWLQYAKDKGLDEEDVNTIFIRPDSSP